MGARQDSSKFADLRGAAPILPVQMEFAFARAAGVTVENLKRMRALRRAPALPRPRAAGLSAAAAGGG
jgi:hypothetical protein